MGSISPRKRKDGSTGYTAQIVLKKDRKVVFTEGRTFDRRAAAALWLEKREAELRAPGGIERAKQHGVTLGKAIDKYVTDSQREMGKTKAQVLNAIKGDEVAEKACAIITSVDLVEFGQRLAAGGRSPATVGNYMSHLGAVFTIARAAWGYALDPQAMKDAMLVLRKLGVIGKSLERDRRPTLDELNRLLAHFADREKRRPGMAPMTKIVLFALFSTRRLEEISRSLRADLDVEGSRTLVRDMKNPGEKAGNHTWCALPPEALAIAQSMPAGGERLFPYGTTAIGANFTRACQLLGIEDLHFHDLRHEGISRLFEMNYSIPRAAEVSGHRSWISLKRYTHLRQTGDKYAGWEWNPLPRSAAPEAATA